MARVEELSVVRRWLMLALSTLGQSASSAVVNGPVFLIPVWHEQGMSLSTAGLLGALPLVGSTCTLVLWGMVVDAVGERFVLLSSLVGSALGLGLAAAFADRPVVLGTGLFVAGAAAAGTSSASGRLVVGWFPPRRRGTAMGIRQMSQPVGVAAAALLVPVLASRYDVATAVTALAVLALAAAASCTFGVLDPPRPPRTEAEPHTNPYLGNRHLLRVHLASVLLVVPQFAVWTFMLVWLQVGRDWSPGAAGSLVAAAQVLGALGRIGAGTLSDVVDSRLRPMAWVAALAALTMASLGLSIDRDWLVAVPLMMLASVVTVADNGLAFTEVAEYAGPYWGGRALGLQNTGQYLTASAVPPVIGAVIPLWGFGAAFGLTGLFPLLALAVIPRDRPRSSRSPTLDA